MPQVRTNEIPQPRWGAFLDQLSKAYKDQPVEVRAAGEDLGDQVLVEGMPLIGISLEKKGSERGNIEIMVARPGEKPPNASHLVQAPRRILVEEAEDGQPLCLDIEDQAGRKTLVFFQEPRHMVTA